METSLTEAGLRDLEPTAFLLDELRAHLAAVPVELRDIHRAKLPIFPTRTGGTLNASNARGRLLKETVKRVNERREKDGRMLLPEKVTPHTLRRTFASLALAAGRDPRWVMGQLRHTDARLTLNVYAQVMQRHRVDEALIWRLMRFPDEPEERHPRAANETRTRLATGTSWPRSADAQLMNYQRVDAAPSPDVGSASAAAVPARPDHHPDHHSH